MLRYRNGKIGFAHAKFNTQRSKPHQTNVVLEFACAKQIIAHSIRSSRIDSSRMKSKSRAERKDTNEFSLQFLVCDGRRDCRAIRALYCRYNCIVSESLQFNSIQLYVLACVRSNLSFHAADVSAIRCMPCVWKPGVFFWLNPSSAMRMYTFSTF